MKITSLGQAGFLLEDDEIRFLIDPYLSNYVVTSGAGDAQYFTRQFPPPFAPALFEGIQAIFLTHDHADHCDPETILPILQTNPECVVVGPQPVLDHLQKEGVQSINLKLAAVYTTLIVGTIRYTAVPSAHYMLDQDPITGEFPNLGYVIEVGGKMLYHAGDTILYQGMMEFLRKKAPAYDVCFLPVNGRDEKRESIGIIGNLQPEEALELAHELKAKLLIPMHNDLFAINHLDPGRLDNYARHHHPDLHIKWLEPSEEFVQ